VAYFLGHKALDPDEQPITRVAVLILGLLSIGYSSLGFWVIILFLAFSEYHSSEIDSSINIKQRQRSILIVSMLFILTILPILFLYEFSDIGKNLSAVIMPNIMGHYGVSQTTEKLLPLISIVFLFCRRIWVNILIIGLLIVGLVFVMSHESQDPVLFQRYSYKAFTAIVIYLIMLFTALLTTIFFNRTHSFISRRLPSRKSIGIIVSQEINRFFDIFSGLTLILDKTRLLIPGRSPLEQRIGIIVVALFALLGLFNTIDINRQARSRDATEMAVWMNQNTPLDSKFLTAEEFLQHNSVSLRPTIVPRPYLVTDYRTLDSRSQDFDEQMLTYWSIDRSEIPKLGWLENAHDDIKDRFYKLNEREILRLAHRFNANYYINRVEKRPLMFDQAYKNSSFIVYSLPELSE
tara:strand:+ start:275 stop:1495 length:1221 start_codon:yes stop_codon:yes gene_type:complete